jgi:hypothetical protein
MTFQLWEVRVRSGGLTRLVRTVEGISSIQQFEDLLAELEINVEVRAGEFG